MVIPWKSCQRETRVFAIYWQLNQKSLILFRIIYAHIYPEFGFGLWDDYLDQYLLAKEGQKKWRGIEELKLSAHFALPLETQKELKEHGPHFVFDW